MCLTIIGCNNKQSAYYQNGDIVFDTQGFPYYYGMSVGMSNFKMLVDGQLWRADGFEYRIIDNKTGKIIKETALIPGLSYQFYVDGNTMTEFLDTSIDQNGTELKYRQFGYMTTPEGFIKNIKEDGKIELRVVSLGADYFDAFMLTGKKKSGEDCYMLITFRKMSEKQLQKCRDTYKEPYYRD